VSVVCVVDELRVRERREGASAKQWRMNDEVDDAMREKEIIMGDFHGARAHKGLCVHDVFLFSYFSKQKGVDK